MFFNEEAQALSELLQKRKYAKAQKWLDRHDQLLLERRDAGACLTAALHASPRLFRRVLEHCEPGEHCGDVHIVVTETVKASVTGTLLTLAAALNRVEHVKILLEAGYDPNSAGVASARAFAEACVYVPENVMAGDFGGYCAGTVSYSGRARWSISCITPLAAAMACGSVQAANILLRRKDVWKRESGAVCRAAVSALVLFGEDPHRQAAGRFFGKNPASPEELAAVCDLRLAHSGDFCSYELLRAQVEGGFCGEEAARAILQTMEKTAMFAHRAVRARIRKLNLLAKAYPQLCRESWVTGIFLRELVQGYTPQTPRRRLMQQWKGLCGAEGDLTWASVELYRKERPCLQALLKELSRDMRLVMDADACGIFGKQDKGELMDILTHVQLRHNQGLEGISSLAATLIRFTDMRYLRKAAKLGAFAGEDPKTLLQQLDELGCSRLRSVVLAYGGKGTENCTPPWKTSWRMQEWSRRWEIEPRAYDRWLQELADEELEREECLRRLHVMGYPECVGGVFCPHCDIRVSLTGKTRKKELCVNHPVAALCCGQQTQPLQLLLEHMPKLLERRYEVTFHDHKLMDLMGTPLGIAAAVGRGEIVRFLLDAGVHPDEQGQGRFSQLNWFGSGLSVTPIMAAIYYGEEETARLLLEAGAVCDFTRPEFRKLLERGDERTLETASRLPDVGFESVPPRCLKQSQNSFF